MLYSWMKRRLASLSGYEIQPQLLNFAHTLVLSLSSAHHSNMVTFCEPSVGVNHLQHRCVRDAACLQRNVTICYCNALRPTLIATRDCVITLRRTRGRALWHSLVITQERQQAYATWTWQYKWMPPLSPVLFWKNTPKVKRFYPQRTECWYQISVQLSYSTVCAAQPTFPFLTRHGSADWSTNRHVGAVSYLFGPDICISWHDYYLHLDFCVV